MNNTEANKKDGICTWRTNNHRRLSPDKLARIIGWAIIGVIIACFFALLFGLLVKWLWGITLTPLFNLPQPTYWQAVGLIILAKLFFGGVGHPHKDQDHSFHHNKWHDHDKDSEEDHEEFYREFWKNEGKKAFMDYLGKRSPTADEEN